MRISTKARSLAASIRLANLPSVWCNTWLGIAIGTLVTGGQTLFAAPAASHAPLIFAWIFLLLPLTSVSCLYLAGNLLNDWWDRHWDATHRPERALPAHHFHPSTYLASALVLACTGISTAAQISSSCMWTAAAILVCITLYTITHKHTILSILPMAMCRALLPLMGAFAVIPSPSFLSLVPVTICSSAIFCHIAGITQAARCEHQLPTQKAQPSGFPPAAGWFFCSAALMSSANFLLPVPVNTPVMIASLLPYLTGILLTFRARRRGVSAQVSWLLAIIPLLDAGMLIPLSAHFCLWPPPVASLCILIPPITFVLGRWLQKLAPAT